MERNGTNNRFELPIEQYRDYLTGAYNRAFLFQIIPQRLKNAEKNNYKIALFMIDVDSFKQVNDTYGHPIGDKVLKGVAESLMSMLRKNDCLIRYAGDEFVVILEDVDLNTAQIIANRMLESVRKSKIKAKNKEITQTTSMGFALFSDDAKDLEELIERADEALYLAKKRNKNNFAYFKEVTLDQASLRAGINLFPCRTFINRQKEISVIRRSLDSFQKTKTTRAIITCGESGIGKSRLLKEASLLAQHQGNELIFSAAYQKNSLSPYFFLIKILNTYLLKNLLCNRNEMLNVIKNINEEKINVLSHFLTALQNIFPPKGEKTGDKNIIFDAFSALLETITSKKGGIFLGIDNLQYSDLATLDFFNFILEKTQKTKLFLFMNILDPIPVGVYNPSAMNNIVAKIGSHANTDVLMLGCLSEEQTTQMIMAVFPNMSVPHDFADIIFEITHGHPFFIEEILRYLLEKTFIHFENDKWQAKQIFKKSLPKTIDEVIRQRLEEMDPEIKETLLISSVIGEEINPAVLSKVKSLGEGDVLEILDKARKLKIIKDEENGFGFLNITTKEATFNEIPDAQRKRIYSRVSTALMDTYKDNVETVSFQLANLFNKVEDIEKLNKFSKMIARRASSIFNPKEVLEYMESFSATEAEEKILFSTKEITDEHIPLAGEFLKLLQNALKNYRLYPKGSKIREGIVELILASLDELFKNYPVINVSEVEKSLILNKRRITSRLVKFIDIDGVVGFLIDKDIKSLIFLKNITSEELDRFFELITSSSEDKFRHSQWKDILASNDLVHISVNKAIYTVPQKTITSHIKEKLDDAMLTDFILGKVSGKDLKNVNLTSVLENNPQALSKELTKAAEFAKRLDGYSDKSNIIFKGMHRLNDLIKKDSQKAGTSAEFQKGIEEKIINVFKEFDPKTKCHLFRMADEQDKLMESIIKSLGSNYGEKLISDAYASGFSLWGLEKLISKLKTVHEYPTEKLQSALNKNILPNLKSDEEKQFIQGKGPWEAFSLEAQFDDILKMDMNDLEEMPLLSLVSVAERLLTSKDFKKFETLFVFLRDSGLSSSSKLATKIVSIYKNVFKKTYTSAQERQKVFKALNALISSVEKRKTKENFDFSLDLIVLITEILGLSNFSGEANFEKMQIFYNLWKSIDSFRNIIGEKGVEAWSKRINFQGIAEDIFDAYVQNVLVFQQKNLTQEAFFKLLSFSLDKIMKNLAKKLSQIDDPFERFVILNKLKGFFSELVNTDLEKLISLALNSFSSNDASDILACIKPGKLSEMFQKIYDTLDNNFQKKVLFIIDKLSLKEALNFVKGLTDRRNNSSLHEKAMKVYAKLKEQ